MNEQMLKKRGLYGTLVWAYNIYPGELCGDRTCIMYMAYTRMCTTVHEC